MALQEKSVRFLLNRTLFCTTSATLVIVGSPGLCKNGPIIKNRTLLMYGVAGEKRPIFLESDAFLYNLDDPS